MHPIFAVFHHKDVPIMPNATQGNVMDVVHYIFLSTQAENRPLISNKISYLFSRPQKALPNQDFGRMKKYAVEAKEIKLLFGCGPRVLRGWVNIDLALEPYEQYLKYYGDVFYPPVLRGDETDFYAIYITKELLPLPDRSVDVIFHEDFLEHLDQRSQMVFLAETLRVLKHGGIHRVNTPDLKASMR